MHLLLPFILACASPRASIPAFPSSTAGLGVNTAASGLSWVVLSEGSGRVVSRGAAAKVAYAGWANGQRFDANEEGIVFDVGAGQVIRGWDEGVEGMRVGERRLLTIPPHLGYGAQGVSGVIPGGATLIFEVVVLSVRD